MTPAFQSPTYRTSPEKVDSLPLTTKVSWLPFIDVVQQKEIRQVNPNAQISLFFDRGAKLQNEQSERAMETSARDLKAEIVNPLGTARNFNEVVQKYDRNELKNQVDRSLLKKEFKASEKTRDKEPKLKRQSGVER